MHRGKERVKLNLFTDDMILDIKKAYKNSLKILSLVKNVSKIARYNMDINNPLYDYHLE